MLENIRETMLNLKDTVEPIAKKAIEKIEPVAEQIKEKAEPVAKKVIETIDPLADKVIDAVDDATHKAADKASEHPGFNRFDFEKNKFMLTGVLAEKGYDWWWHNFTAINSVTGEEKQFFVEYFMINPALGGVKPIFGQLAQNQEIGIKPSYVCVKAGTWGKDACQLHRFFGWREVKFTTAAPFILEADDCYASEGRIAGSVAVTETANAAHPEWMSDAGSMSWSLSVDKKIAYNVGYGTSNALREMKAFDMYWHAEGMKTEYSGWVDYNGERYLVKPESSYGYADKNWGKDFTSPWLWLSSNNLYSKKLDKQLLNSAFDIGGGKPVAFGVEFDDKLLGAMYYEGTEMEFNFSKAWMLPKTRFEVDTEGDDIIWHVEQENSLYFMKTIMRCSKEDMLLINYEAPDGSKKHNHLYNGGNAEGVIKLYKKVHNYKELIDEIVVKNAGCEWGVMDE